MGGDKVSCFMGRGQKQHLLAVRKPINLLITVVSMVKCTSNWNYEYHLFISRANTQNTDLMFRVQHPTRQSVISVSNKQKGGYTYNIP